MTDRAIRDMLESEAERFEQEKDTAKRQYVRPAPARTPSQVYSIRIPVEELEALRKIAAARHMPPSALMREWVLERLSYEATPRANRARMLDRATRARMLERYSAIGAMDVVEVEERSPYIVMKVGTGPPKRETVGLIRSGAELAG
jgi:Ribbon-helix-helix protein, copG family